ncbi:MAG TPA: sigma-70 family RNA polymerase sigma factor [Bryobacteraceae bacterium]|nr:sigma-70 family RNA polymerase sigma factor [Bryobacteraceae bacterium]
MQPEELAVSPLEAGAAGGERWLEAAFCEHYPRMVGVLARVTGDRGQAEEIAAETFAKLARRRLLWPARHDPAAWLYRVALNAALDAARANARRRRTEQAAGSEQLRSAPAGGALEELLRNERCERVRAVLASLKPRDARLLLLRSSGLPYREIAHALGVQASSIGTLLARAERDFERRYRARYGEEI